jgi:long-chain acyl-CoA synthetase
MEFRTLCELFYRSVDTYRKLEHLKVKRDGAWRAIGSDELRQAVEEIATALRGLGVARGERVAILSENRPEWAMVDFAALCAGAIDVPIYSTLTAPQILYLLQDSEAKVLFVSTQALYKKVAEVRDKATALKEVVMMDPVAVPGTLAFDELRRRGRETLAQNPGAVRAWAAEAKPEDIATFIYTSGTTGDPKGVMLTHSNLVSNTIGSSAVFGLHGGDESCLSFLPLSHVFERMSGHYLMFEIGATIAYAESVDKVPENMLEVRPTILMSVPRLYEKMYARVNEKVAADPPARQKIFRWALRVGKRIFQHQVQATSPGLFLRLQGAIAEALVFSKIKQRTGGRIKLFVSGGAPLAREIAEFFGAAGFVLLEGYGLTETSPVIAVNRPQRMKPGTVGPAIKGVEMKIAEDGEILTRGPHVMKGYFKNPAATAEAIDPDGWFHTGDIGVIDADGYLTITDRKKDIIVTSGGKNIAPQPIENRVKTNKFFAELCMIGNRRNYPSALVIPNFETLEAWARTKGIPTGSREELIAHPEVVAHYDQLLKELTSDLAQFEKIKKFTLLPREFSIEGGELTPKLSVKRKVVEQKYKHLIDRMYEGSAA